MIIYGINCPKIVHIMRLSERPDFGADDKHLWKRSQQFVYLFLKELSTSIGQTGQSYLEDMSGLLSKDRENKQADQRAAGTWIETSTPRHLKSQQSSAFTL
ncbi:hypothetical protein PVK06_010201 [Gossypium arboreum]|uniref:Uncharacterized protein n=1 Tax=Gossypium arboreum TaxID=29729 RepID=A0ABR0QQW1_GOSAR|nr:hypothetical protein PVK06_010201 [Gossypium arboreum]